jgi:hypothetical protein
VICKGCKQANAQAGAKPVPEGLGGLWVVFRPKPLPPFEGMSGVFWDACHSFLKDRWILGVTSDKGYLGPPVFDRKNWDSLLTGSEKARCEAMWAGILPDVYRFTPGQEYEFYFVQHPSYALAREVQDQLNFGKQPENAYGPPIPLKPDADGRIEIEESPQTFWPSRMWKDGDDKFYGWCLFNGMPSANCAPVKQQVIRLQAHLGALRYPVGDHAWPYEFHVPRDGGEGDFNVSPDNDGVFDVRVMNAVYKFQKQAPILKPFQVQSKPHETLVDYQNGYASKITRERRATKDLDLESEANTFAYLRGAYLKQPFTPAPAGKPDGVVESSTARAIKAWLDNRLRKPGEILVRHRGVWMRPDLAKSLYGWHELALALGSFDGVVFGHAFRQIFHNLDDSLGAGAAVMSPHKTGLAVDMGSEKWMRVYEPNDKRGVVDGRFYWTILGFSDVECPGADKDAWREKLRGRVEQHKLVGEPELVAYAKEKLQTLGDLIDAGQVDAFFRPTAKPWLFDPSDEHGGAKVSEWVPQQCFNESGQFILYPWFDLELLDRKLKQIDSTIESLEQGLNPDPARLQALKTLKADKTAEVEKLKAKIGKLKAEKRKASFQYKDPATKVVEKREVQSFLNLTHVAEIVRLHPIRWAPGMGYAYSSNLDALNLTAIAKAVRSGALVPEVVSEHPVEIDRAGTPPITINLAKIDTDFVRDWPSLLKNVASALGPKAKLAPPRFTFEVSADTPRAKEAAEKLAAVLKTKPFAKRYFYAPPPYAGERAARTGEQWATYIVDELASKVGEWVKERAARFLGYGVPDSAVSRLAEQPPPAPLAVEGQPNEKPPEVELWTICLQPVFLRQYTPTDPAIPNEFPFFPGDSVRVPGPGVSRCQEWWHFQREDLLGRRFDDWELRLPKEKKDETPPSDGVVNDGTWRSWMEMIGWTRECLSGAPSVDLYGRRGVGYKL